MTVGALFLAHPDASNAASKSASGRTAKRVDEDIGVLLVSARRIAALEEQTSRIAQRGLRQTTLFGISTGRSACAQALSRQCRTRRFATPIAGCLAARLAYAVGKNLFERRAAGYPVVDSRLFSYAEINPVNR